MTSRDHKLRIELRHRPLPAAALAPVLRALASWLPAPPDRVERVREADGADPWSDSWIQVLAERCQAGKRTYWLLLHGKETVLRIRCTDAGVWWSVEVGRGDVPPADWLARIAQDLAAAGAPPPAMAMLARVDAPEDFLTQGLAKLTDVPPVLFLDDTALARVGGLERLGDLAEPLPPFGAVLRAATDPAAPPDATERERARRIAEALGLEPGKPLSLAGAPAAPAAAMPAKPRFDLAKIDRAARGFERAVVASTTVGGDPIVLDRTLSSLAPLDRYLGRPPAGALDQKALAQRAQTVGDYLAVVALTERGVHTDLAALDPWDAARRRVLSGQPLDPFAARLAALPPAGPANIRPRVIQLRVQLEALDATIARRVATWVAGLPILKGARGEGRLPDEWRAIVDSDEARADLTTDEGPTFALTQLTTAGDAVADDLLRRWGELARAARPLLGVAYDIDEPAAVAYALRGFSGGMPRWLFLAADAADRVGEARLIESAPCPVAREGNVYRLDVEGRPDVPRHLGLEAEWPHLR